jgi:DNA-binding FadR family transcriptional regulator
MRTDAVAQSAPISSAGERRRVSTVVADQILEAITAKTLADPQNRLPSERELADRFHVSRTSIREALQHLSSIGVVELSNRARARVIDFDSSAFYQQLTDSARVMMSKQQIFEFQEARGLFEGGLVRYAARHATPKQIGKITQALIENERALKDPERFIETDLQFHRILAEVPGNPIFMSMQQAIEAWYGEQRAETIGVSHGRTYADEAPIMRAIQDAYDGHAAIVRAIVAKDPEEADRALNEHLMLVFTYMLRARSDVPTDIPSDGLSDRHILY